MTRWFRFYDDAINDPKLLRLSDEHYRAWITLLCVASKNGGTLPPTEDIALILRIRPAKVVRWVETLCAAELFQFKDGVVSPIPMEPESRRLCASEWAELRAAVFHRDNYTCTYCGSRGRLECDHIHPLSRGGSNDIENLTTACFGCNRSKMDKTMQEWRP